MIKLVDLFSGAGGLSLGFEQVPGFYTVGVIENNEYALETYLKNRQPNQNKILIERDIRSTDLHSFKKLTGKIDVLIGGPPCQGFSNANRQRNKFLSNNNLLVKKYVEAVKTLSPSVFVLENVGMIKSDTHKFFDSSFDHDDIIKLNINLKPESVVVYDNNIDGEETIKIFENHSEILRLLVTNQTYKSLRILDKILSQIKCKLPSTKLTEWIRINKNFLESELSCYEKKLNDSIIDKLIKVDINKTLNFLVVINEFTILEAKSSIHNLLDFQKALHLMEELIQYNIIYELFIEGNKVKIRTKSYSVLNYIIYSLMTEYDITTEELNSINYGVPQERKRFFMVGVKKGIGKNCKFVFPSPSSEKLTVFDAIGDLEEVIPSHEVAAIPINRRVNDAHSDYAKSLIDGCSLIYNHTITQTSEIALLRFKSLKQGENFHDLSTELKTSYTDIERTQNSIYKRLDFSHPSGTVVNIRKSMWIHPTKDRAVSIREAARIQSFPDNYIFYGPKDSQYQQVGNAVPPKLANAIAKSIFKLFDL